MFPSLTESYFAAVAEASPDVMRILELDGTVEFMNARGLALLEIDRFDANRHRRWSDLWPEATRPELLASLEIAIVGGIGRFRGFCPTAKGKPRWWDSVVSPIRDDAGHVVRLLASSRDVTAEVRREERLRKAALRIRRAKADKARSLDHLRAAVDAMPGGIAFFDADDRLTMCNAAYEAACVRLGGDEIRVGRTYRQLLQRSLSLDLFPEALGREGEWLEANLAARERGEAREQMFSDGRWYRYEDCRLPDGGLISAAFDITALKGRERDMAAQAVVLAEAKAAAESASEAKSVFLANMSHEIRTPLNGILAMADLLCGKPLAPDAAEMAGVVRESALMLDHLLSDILDLARIESGDAVLDLGVFDLRKALENVIALARPRAAEKGLELTLAIGARLDQPVSGDVNRLKQLLNNLLSNAVKFTHEGSISLTASRQDGGTVRFTVEDTGVGFDPADKSRLFRRFEQMDPSITRRYGGSGLGLAICHQLAVLMEGTLDCDASPGRGARFWATVPLEQANEPDQAAGWSGPSALSSLRVLAADDHPANRKIVEMIMGSAGAETHLVTNGAEAVAACRSMAFDLVLMDIQMPVLDGLSAVREIRAWERAAGRWPVPILMLSANVQEEYVDEAAASGADGHVGKPVTADRLLSEIAQVLDHHHGDVRLAASGG